MKKRKPAPAPRPAPPPEPVVSPKLTLLVCLALALATLAIYAQTASHGYIAYDDDQYVYENHWVQAGLSPANLAWAFTTFFYANWHPFTWISYMLDITLFGPNAGPQHMVNLAFHLASSLLLFLAFSRMTRRLWPSALLAALFALHPLRVESVAWISERKDVLSTFFEILTLLAYLRYAARPAAKTYLPVAACFLLSLLSKPMAVTFPFVLLLLDFWPLRRLSWPPALPAARRLLLEKFPLLALSALASVLTFLAQRDYGAVMSLAKLPLSVRAANAAIAYVSYIGKAFWPSGLAVLYPVRNLDPRTALLSGALLAALTAAALFSFRRRPWIAVGWLWYLGTLVPVIGLVQVGVQAMADRYTYLPMIGLSLALVWTLADALDTLPSLRPAAAPLALAALAFLALAAFRQTAYWKSSRTLFEHTLAVTRDNRIIQNNLGVILASQGQNDQAVTLYRAALAIDPDYAEAHANLGHELLKAGQFDQALTHLQKALQLKPATANAHADLGLLLAARNQFDDARRELQRALQLNPANADTESNLCYVLTHQGHPAEAIPHCNSALRLDPASHNAKFNLQNAQAALAHQHQPE